MASSGYWKGLKNEAWNKYKARESEYNYLKDVRGNLDQTSAVKDVNNAIESCVSEMKKALTGRSKFTANANALGQQKQSYMGSTPRLSSAHNLLTAEMDRLTREKDKAYEDYKTYARREEAARQAEAAEARAAAEAAAQA